RLGCHVDLVMAPEPVGSPLGDLFARRAHAVALLQHPALPPVLDMGLQDSHIVLVYRHTDGRSLAELSARETEDWTEHRVLHVVADLATALGLAHAHGLCHGSFSAQSVLVERDGMVTILDLAWPRAGTAVDHGDAAPEMRLGHAPTPRADVFALGQVLRRLTLMTGPEAGRGLDIAVQGVVRRATAWRPQERYADGAALAQAIARLLDRPPATQPPTSAAPPRVARQRPQVAAAPAARHPLSAAGRSGTQRFLCGALLPLALSLAIGLLPVAGAAVHDVITHVPFVGFPLQRDDDGWRTGWRSWGQGPLWHPWRAGRPDRSWRWRLRGTDPDDSSP
ncbi:MAG TPA: protein kinase, partial [Chloroflexota bacterium]|nr:protein kinase [Chloroflexota bacterium]